MLVYYNFDSSLTRYDRLWSSCGKTIYYDVLYNLQQTIDCLEIDTQTLKNVYRANQSMALSDSRQYIATSELCIGLYIVLWASSVNDNTVDRLAISVTCAVVH